MAGPSQLFVEPLSAGCSIPGYAGIRKVSPVLVGAQLLGTLDTSRLELLGVDGVLKAGDSRKEASFVGLHSVGAEQDPRCLLGLVELLSAGLRAGSCR